MSCIITDIVIIMIIMRYLNLTDDNLDSLRLAHKSEKNKKIAYRINAIILLGTGWSISRVSVALLLNQQSLYNYISNYKKGGIKKLLSTDYKGRPKISIKKTMYQPLRRT